MTAQVLGAWVCQRKQVNTDLYLTCIPLLVVLFLLSITYINILALLLQFVEK